MRIHSKTYTSLWYDESADRIWYIDQNRLPFELVVRELKTFADGVRAIRDMEVRGAPLIGVTAAFTLYAGVRELHETLTIPQMADILINTRPTAVNLAYAVGIILATGRHDPESILNRALAIRTAELSNCRLIGEEGLNIIQQIAATKPGEPVNILTHCNAGWLATVDYGTALAPIYLAHDQGIPVHIWVDETRPRNQGARLTAFELGAHGVPNTLIVDNAGGLLMQQGKVDLVIVGADRITTNGDVINKIGTYLKALAAFDNQIPFYVAAPLSTFDPETLSGSDVVIEERPAEEVLFIGDCPNPQAPPETRVHNPGFDVTPARLIAAIITERGIKNR
jgi:methylthioribose-1-phosphate isomerase